MSKREQDPEAKKRQLAGLKPFTKNDPRINKGGRPKQLPLIKELMKQLLGGEEGENITDTEAAAVVKALIEEAKSKRPGKVAAAKEILERAFGKVKDEVDVRVGQVVWNETKTYKKAG